MRAHAMGPAHRWRRAARDLVALALVLMSGAAHAAPAVHHVRIENQHFVPDSLVARVGDRIVWDNADLVPHTATASAAGWDTGLIKPGAQASVLLKAAGPVRYVCRYHPHMTASVRVRAVRGR